MKVFFILLFSVIGIFLIYLGSSRQYRLHQKVTSGNYAETIGTVVDYNVHTDSDGSTFAPIIEYEVNGQNYRHVQQIYARPAKPLGKRVRIKYNVNNPTDSVVKHETIHILTVFFGVLFLGFSVLMIFVHQ